MKRNKWIGWMIMPLLWGCAASGPASRTEGPPIDVAAEEKIADPNAYDEEGLTPLMKAAQADRPDQILELLRSGARLDLKDPEGRMAIDRSLEHRRFSAFKCLLENGAVAPSEKETDLKSRDDPGLSPFKDILEEYPFYAVVAADPLMAHMDDFDRYFTRFPDGVYRDAMSNFFKKSAEHHLQELSVSPDPDQLRRFISDIHQMGSRRYIVIAPRLNIRSSAGSRSPAIGSYLKNDVLYSESSSGEWIKTDKGWVSKRHLKRQTLPAPHAKEILEKANALIASTIAAQRVKTGGTETFGAQMELEKIFKAPNLQSLEDFILKYRHTSGAELLVEKAKNTYKSLILGK